MCCVVVYNVMTKYLGHIKEQELKVKWKLETETANGNGNRNMAPYIGYLLYQDLCVAFLFPGVLEVFQAPVLLVLACEVGD